MKARVKELSESCGWGPVAVRNHIVSRKLIGWDLATQGRVNMIMNTQSQKTVVSDVYEAVVSTLEDAVRSGTRLDSHQKNLRRVTVDSRFAADLERLLAQFSQLSTAKALCLWGAPSDLTHVAVGRVASGKQKSLKREHFEFLQAQIGKLTKSKES